MILNMVHFWQQEQHWQIKTLSWKSEAELKEAGNVVTDLTTWLQVQAQRHMQNSYQPLGSIIWQP